MIKRFFTSGQRALFALAFCICSIAIFATTSFGQTSTGSFAIQMTASVQESPPQITLNWPANQYAQGIMIYKRQLSGNTNLSSGWSQVFTSGTFNTSFSDTAVNPGTLYEYKATSTNPGYYDAVIGLITTGIKVPLTENRGKVIFIVDATKAQALSTELTRLALDMTGDGWTVIRHDVQPTDTPPSVRAIIQNDYNADPANVHSVLLFGAIPVPYAGPVAPDSHVESYSPWPADVYYGVMHAEWTPGSPVSGYPEGYFANTYTPAEADLEVGRVDLSKMPAFAPKTEVDLLRQYADKDHKIRNGLITPEKRGLITDHFNYTPFLGGEDFAAATYNTIASSFGPLFINDTAWQGSGITDANFDQTFPALSRDSYTWAGLFSGGMSNGIWYTGMTKEFADRDPKAGFVTSFGSSFGYWSGTDNFLRAPLGGSTLGLSNSWSGRPRQFYHRTAMGLTLGDSMRVSQNTGREIWTALMGDPTLRTFVVAPSPAIAAQINGQSVVLNWTSSPDPTILGYVVYRSVSQTGSFTKLNSQLLTSTSFTDAAPPIGTNFYMVRAVKLERTASGSFYNASQGIFQSVTLSNANPSVGIISPMQGGVINLRNGAPVSVELSAIAGSLGGNISKVGFLVNGVSVGEDFSAGLITAPSMTNVAGPSVQGYSINWNATAPGNYSVQAIATDQSGRTTTSASVAFSVRPLMSPQISAALTSGSQLNPGEKFTVDVQTTTATASDQVAKVQLLVGSNVVSEMKREDLPYDFISSINIENSPLHRPYNVSFSTTQAGTYQLIARSITNLGMTADATPIQVTVVGGNGGAPSISIVSPVTNDQFIVNSSNPVVVNASTSVSNDSIIKVDLNANAVRVDTSTSFPFTTTFHPTSTGTYTLTATATTRLGQTATSLPVTVTVVNPPPPPVPTGVKADAGDRQVTISWNSSNGATTYNLYRATTSGGEGVTPYKTGIAAASFVDTGLTNGTTYFYKVTALNSSAESSQSSEVNATPHSNTNGDGRVIYRINAGGAKIGSFDADNFFIGGVAWSTDKKMDISGVTDPAPAEAYQFVRYDPSQFSYSFPGLTSGHSYKVRLHMIEPFSWYTGTRPMNIDINGARVLTNFDPANAAGGSFKAIIPEFTVPADSNGKITITFIRTTGDVPCVAALEIIDTAQSAPGTPTGFTAVAGNGQIALSWNGVAGATSYNLYRATTSGGQGVTPYKTGITTASFVDTGLTNGTTYFYKVTALNSPAESAKSVEVSTTPFSNTNSNGRVIYRINSSGAKIGNFDADNYFNGGIAWSTGTTMDVSGVIDPAPAEVYQSARYDQSQFSYSFPELTAGKNYKVRLHMIEPFTWWAIGTRPMNIDINDTRVLTNFDPATAAGKGLKAVIPEFIVPADSNGKITIKFMRTTGDVPCVAALEIIDTAQQPSDILSGSLGKPTGVAATASTKMVTITWNTVEGATSYNLYRSTTAKSKTTKPYKKVIKKIPYIISKTNNQGKYYYRVSAVNKVGESPLSAAVIPKKN